MPGPSGSVLKPLPAALLTFLSTGSVFLSSKNLSSCQQEVDFYTILSVIGGREWTHADFHSELSVRVLFDIHTCVFSCLRFFVYKCILIKEHH